MIQSPGYFYSRASAHLLVILSGLATLSWEVLWQIKIALALGVSAWGAALTLAITMGGLCVGSLSMGHALKGKRIERPVRLYGALEIIVGIFGLCLTCAFGTLERLDTHIYGQWPDAAPLVHILGIIVILGIPTICMGATLPVFGLMSRQYRTSIAVLYGLNTLGAAVGALFVAFALIPQIGVAHTVYVIALINIAVGLCAWALAPGMPATLDEPKGAPIAPPSGRDPAWDPFIVFVTGFATFTLEIAWFRSFTAAFKSTTDVFAIMLASVLIALGAAAQIAPGLKKKNASLGFIIGWAGILILAVTPLIERFDYLTNSHERSGAPAPVVAPHIVAAQSFYAEMMVAWFAEIFVVVAPAIFLLGIALPWILDEQKSTQKWGKLYALNTFAAIIGALGAAWLLLPTVGFARTAWLAGTLVVIAGILIAPSKQRIALMALGIVALATAVTFESGIGRTRVQGNVLYGSRQLDKILEFYEGPEATVTAVKYVDGGRVLVVDGFLTASQGDKKLADRYMEWMGHLPMLLTPDPKNALVICFGTGQTSNAVRQENPQSLDIVDINPRVFRLAHNFTANQNVLGDPRVHAIVMDGRAYIRRTTKTYDVVTLEPMPPNFVGVNALYSKEFYEFARKKLSAHGVIAQWVPFHLISPQSSVSIVKTFLNVFPDAILWIDPNSQTGILLGSKDNDPAFGTQWPGLKRTQITRDLSDDELRKGVLLDHTGLETYSKNGELVSDDNQLLAYGKAMASTHFYGRLSEDNFELLGKVAKPKP